MGVFKKNGLTKITGIIILITVIFTQFSQKKWNSDLDVIAGDVRGYYGYLPALFIHNDLKLENPEIFDSPYGQLIWHSESKDGTRFIKYTCGMAVLYSPFFIVAHSVAESLGEEANGFSYPYMFALAMSSIVYLLIALIFLSKLLLRFFNDSVVSITLLVIFAGSNALHYYTGNMTYSHGYSLALIAVFLYCTVRWLDEPKLKWAIWIGITSGLFVLIRPIDILFLLALPLFNVGSLEGAKQRFNLFWQKKAQVLVMMAGFFLMLVPQFIYFKLISGSFIFYSYTGESFYFGHPHLFDSLLSYRNGWLVYSPMMALSIIGLFFLQKQKAVFSSFLFPVVLIYFFIISSWWCWWYVGHGNRAYINLYPLLAISLACFIQYVLSKGRFFRLTFKLFILIGLVFSGFQTYQFHTGAIHWGAMTKDAYWDSFLREKPSQIFSTLLRFPSTDDQIAGKDIVMVPKKETVYTITYNFDELNNCDTTMHRFIQFQQSRKGKGALSIEEGTEYLGKMPISVKGAGAIYATAWIKNLPDELHLTLSKTEPVSYYHSSFEECDRDGEWRKIHMLSWIPESLGTDSLDFVIWNQGKHAFILDDLKIKALKYTYTAEER